MCGLLSSLAVVLWISIAGKPISPPDLDLDTSGCPNVQQLNVLKNELLKTESATLQPISEIGRFV